MSPSTSRDRKHWSIHIELRRHLTRRRVTSSDPAEIIRVSEITIQRVAKQTRGLITQEDGDVEVKRV